MWSRLSWRASRPTAVPRRALWRRPRPAPPREAQRRSGTSAREGAHHTKHAAHCSFIPAAGAVEPAVRRRCNYIAALSRHRISWVVRLYVLYQQPQTHLRACIDVASLDGVKCISRPASFAPQESLHTLCCLFESLALASSCAGSSRLVCRVRCCISRIFAFQIGRRCLWWWLARMGSRFIGADLIPLSCGCSCLCVLVPVSLYALQLEHFMDIWVGFHVQVRAHTCVYATTQGPLCLCLFAAVCASARAAIDSHRIGRSRNREARWSAPERPLGCARRRS